MKAKRLMNKMVDTAIKHGKLMESYKAMVKFCDEIGVSEEEIKDYMYARYSLELEKI